MRDNGRQSVTLNQWVEIWKVLIGGAVKHWRGLWIVCNRNCARLKVVIRCCAPPDVNMEGEELDTARSEAWLYGDRVAALNHGVVRREPTAVGLDYGPGWKIAWQDSGVRVNPAAYEPQAREKFVAGGFNRAKALAHLRMTEGGTVAFGEGGILGPEFDKYLSGYPPEELVEIYLDYRDGINALRILDARALAWCPAPGIDQLARRTRDCWPEMRNGKNVEEHLEFVCAKVTQGVVDGTIEHLGTVEEAREAGKVPWLLSPLTVEPSKREYSRHCDVPCWW